MLHLCPDTSRPRPIARHAEQIAYAGNACPLCAEIANGEATAVELHCVITERDTLVAASAAAQCDVVGAGRR